MGWRGKKKEMHFCHIILFFFLPTFGRRTVACCREISQHGKFIEAWKTPLEKEGGTRDNKIVIENENRDGSSGKKGRKLLPIFSPRESGKYSINSPATGIFSFFERECPGKRAGCGSWKLEHPRTVLCGQHVQIVVFLQLDPACR